jgi:ABC-2 type transport system ATP-binding protein
MNPIAFERLTAYYGATKALDTLTLAVPPASVFALLGRNGAGKTTAIKCLLGFLAPTRGTARILGLDARALPPEARGRIGYVAEGQRLVPWMRVQELVAYQRASFPTFDGDLCRAHLKRLGLPERRRVFQLSRGMRAQLALALALAPRPEVLVLDDPAMGLDAVVRREFLDVMIDLIAEEGRTVLFSSHILTDVERVADRVAILDRGVLRVNAPLDEVKRRVRRWHARFEGEAPEPPALPGLVRARRQRDELVLTVVDGDDKVEAACRGLGARAVEPEPLALEDLFVDYTATRGEVMA